MPGYDEFKEEYSVIGKPGLKDKTLLHKITGKLDYADDHLPGRKLAARALLSPYARAEVTSIDTSAAEALPGVYAVTTFEDCPVLRQSIRWWGADIAAVAAIDEETAMRAIELIEVEYDVGNHIVDPEEAMEPGAPLTGIWDDTNVSEAEQLRGDVETGLAEADQEIEVEAGWSNYFQHKEMEPWSATVYWLGEHLYVWTTSQNPFAQRAGIAGTLDMPHHYVHLVSHGSGSGHGNKHGPHWIIVAACLAKKAGMPVSFHCDRLEQQCSSSVHQNAGKLNMKVGVKNDGTITAIDATFTADGCGGGATTGLGMNFPIRYTFKCDHARFRAVDVATNKPLRGAWRCVADPPGDALGLLGMTKVAYELGMDPLDFFLKNLITQDEAQPETGMPFSSLGIKECFEKAAEAIGWDDKWHAPGERTLDDGRMHGIGISGHVDAHGAPYWVVGAILNLTPDGKCLINPGQSHCAGSIISHAHHTAEALGMKYEDVEIGDWGDTDTASEGGMEGGSSRTIGTGGAYVEAARDARRQAFDVAAEWMGVEPDDLDAEDGVIYEKANPDNSRTWKEVAGRFPHYIIGRGYTPWPQALRRPVLDWDVGTDCEVRGQLAQAVEIAVDTETGHIEVLNFANAVDGGKVISHSNYHKQMYGGSEIIMGETLLYTQILDNDSGATLNANMMQNTFPTSMDLKPAGFKNAPVESDDHYGPHGCKGIGEPCVSAIGCMASAFYNATGVWIDELPITPDKVLKALGKA